jgi:hypothetical protein
MQLLKYYELHANSSYMTKMCKNVLRSQFFHAVRVSESLLLKVFLVAFFLSDRSVTPHLPLTLHTNVKLRVQ